MRPIIGAHGLAAGSGDGIRGGQPKPWPRPRVSPDWPPATRHFALLYLFLHTLVLFYLFTVLLQACSTIWQGNMGICVNAQSGTFFNFPGCRSSPSGGARGDV